jgi:hypothetical protein
LGFVALTDGIGFTVIVTVTLFPVQDDVLGVMVKVVVCEVLVIFTRVPVMVEPLPLVAIPVRLVVLLRVQVNAVPAIPFGLVMSIGVMADPEHRV